MLDAQSSASLQYAAATGGDPATGEAELVALLRHHYGDGGVYVPQGGARRIFAAATGLGYVNEDGYLTRKGRELLAKHGD